MGLFDFFKKKTDQSVELFNPVKGEVISIDAVSDPVFSQKMMGDGFGVEPTTGEIYSPVEGEVISVFPTKHALGLKLENGIEVLIHIGIDTVELDGGPFEVFVSEGTSVSSDTLLAKVDLDALAEAEKDSTVIVVFTNMDAVESFTLSATGDKAQGDTIGKIVGK